MLLAVVCVEVPYQVEELLFRPDRNRVRDYVEASLGENGAYPTEEVFKANGPKLISRDANIVFNEGQEGYTIFWSRPLCSGYSINCSSEDDHILDPGLRRNHGGYHTIHEIDKPQNRRSR